MFKISDKVVCVDDKFAKEDNAFYYSLPVAGVVYVVREVYWTTSHDIPVVGICVTGVHGKPCDETGLESGFRAWRFRKLEDIKEENRKKQEEPQPV